MKKTQFQLLVCTLTLGLGASAIAKDQVNGGDLKPTKKASAKSIETVAPAPAKEPLIGVKVIISPSEREIIQSYVTSRSTSGKPGKKSKGLPPGLAKKLERGGDLPPGWQKKCVPGQTMPREVYEQCRPLPREVVVELPTHRQALFSWRLMARSLDW